jgi:hypothetical protein
VSLGSVLTKCSPWASPPQLCPWARTSKEPSSARERPPPRGLFLLPTAALDGPRRYRRRPRSSPMTLPDPTGDAVRFSALRSSAEISVGAAKPHRGSSRAKGLRRQRLIQAKLSRNSNQIARGRIRRFESYMPSHAVGLQPFNEHMELDEGEPCSTAPASSAWKASCRSGKTPTYPRADHPHDLARRRLVQDAHNKSDGNFRFVSQL